MNLKELLLPNGTYTDQLCASGCHWDFLQVKKVCTSRESHYEGKAYQSKSLKLLIFRKVKDLAILIMMTNTNVESPHFTKLFQVFLAAFTSGSSYSFELLFLNSPSKAFRKEQAFITICLKTNC